MSEKLNVGNAKFNNENFEIHINIDDIIDMLELDEVKISLRHYVGKHAQPRRSLKLYAAKLEVPYANKYQTHSVRIDTTYRQKEKPFEP